MSRKSIGSHRRRRSERREEARVVGGRKSSNLEGGEEAVGEGEEAGKESRELKLAGPAVYTPSRLQYRDTSAVFLPVAMDR